MALTYKPLATTTVGSGGAASIDFTSISSAYTDLCIWVSGRSSRSNHLDDLYIRFNSNATGYNGFLLGTDGGGPISITYSSPGFVTAANAAGNTFGCVTIYIPNYTAAQNKSYSSDSVTENNSASAYGMAIQGGVWANSSAITSIALTLGSGNFAHHSIATLYGIKNS